MGGEDHTVADRPGPLVITRRGIRLVHTIAVTILALLILGVAGIATGNGSSGDEWLSLPQAQALDAAPCPPPSSIPVAPTSESRLAAAREGRFRVFGPRPTLLRVPIDWSTDPLGSHRYRQNLQKLRFIGPIAEPIRNAARSALIVDQHLTAVAQQAIDAIETQPELEAADADHAILFTRYDLERRAAALDVEPGLEQPCEPYALELDEADLQRRAAARMQAMQRTRHRSLQQFLKPAGLGHVQPLRGFEVSP